MATQVVCGWAGAVMKLKNTLKKLLTLKKTTVRVQLTNQQTNEPTNMNTTKQKLKTSRGPDVGI